MDEKNKAELTKLLQQTESLEVFWFPFNGIFDLLIKKDEEKAIITGLEDLDVVKGKVIRMATSPSDTWWWDPWNDDLWCREINFTTDKVTKE